MNYTIREMLPTDGDRVLAIFEEGIAGGNATFDTVAPSWEAWNTKFFQCCRFVAVDSSGKVQGWAALLFFSGRDCFKGVAEVSIYLSDSAQGKGLGSLLLKTLIKASEENEFWSLQAGIFPENVHSIALHQKFGFREVGFREKIGQMNGEWRDVTLLERRSKIVGV